MWEARRALDVCQPQPEDVVLVECLRRAREAGSVCCIMLTPKLPELKSLDFTVSESIIQVK